VGALTYISIEGEVKVLCRQGRLVDHEPAIPGGPKIRTLCIHPDIQEKLDGPWADREEEERWGYLRADLDRFIEDDALPLRRPGTMSAKAYLARLVRVREVWEIRSVAPDPSLRVFGRFAAPDLFIGLLWRTREELRGPGSREWRQAIIQCRAFWRNLFPSYPPHTGEYPHDYISQFVLV